VLGISAFTAAAESFAWSKWQGARRVHDHLVVSSRMARAAVENDGQTTKQSDLRRRNKVAAASWATAGSHQKLMRLMSIGGVRPAGVAHWLA